jgi:hypothetical protein
MTKNKENFMESVPNPFKYLPYFKTGSLVFSDGHKLTFSDGHYRCILNCRGKCQRHNIQKPSNNLERSFARYAQDFAISQIEATKILEKIVRANFADLLFDSEEEVNQEKQRESQLLLFSLCYAVLNALVYKNEEMQLGKLFAIISKRIELNDQGEIIKVEFEPWGWYVLSLINKGIPNYFYYRKQKRIKIINKIDDNLAKLSISEVSSQLSKNAQAILNNNDNVKFMKDIVKFAKDNLGMIFRIQDPESLKQLSGGFMKQLTNHPLLAPIMKIAAINKVRVNKIKDDII